MPNVARMLRKAAGPVLSMIPGVGPVLGGAVTAANAAYEKSGIGVDVLSAAAPGVRAALGSAGGSSIPPGMTPEQAAKVGAGIDRQSAIDQYTDRYKFLRAEGATLSEVLGTQAGGGQSGALQTLGNSASQRQLQAEQRAYDAQQRDLDRQVQIRSQDMQLAATQLQAATSIETAGISADASRFGATTSAQASMFNAMTSAEAMKYVGMLNNQAQNYATEVRKALGEADFNLRTSEFVEVVLPKAMAELELTAAQTEKALNEVATSDPAFIMKRLMFSMGPENLLVSLAAAGMEIDLDDPSTYPQGEEMEGMLLYLAGLGSKIYAESGGISNLQVRAGTGRDIDLNADGKKDRMLMPSEAILDLFRVMGVLPSRK